MVYEVINKKILIKNKVIEEEKNKTEKNYTHEMKGSEKCFKKKS